MENKVDKMEEEIKRNSHDDFGAEEMYKRVTILNNLGILVENL